MTSVRAPTLAAVVPSIGVTRFQASPHPRWYALTYRRSDAPDVRCSLCRQFDLHARLVGLAHRRRREQAPDPGQALLVVGGLACQKVLLSLPKTHRHHLADLWVGQQR